MNQPLFTPKVPSPPLPAVGLSSATEADYKAALQFLYDRLNYERIADHQAKYEFRLQRITALVKGLKLESYLHGEPGAPRVPLVHLAGTKGKGSTAAMVASMLSACGLRTGLYTSPHLHTLEERFRIDGQPCSASQFISLVDRIRPVAAVVEAELGTASFFELTTAMAMLHFDTSRCDAVVVEVGLGGRLDSTNVYAPSVSAITSIGMDHQHVLGNTLREIAGEKAGIIKPGVPVVSGVRDAEPAEVIQQVAQRQQAPLYQLDRDFQCQVTPQPHWGSKLKYTGLTEPLRDSIEASLSMDGLHQSRNAALAIALVQLLQHQGVPLGSSAICDGLAELQCAGRVERFVLPQDRWVIVDSAHNEDSIGALCEILRARCQQRPVNVVFGTSIDKTAETMLAPLGEIARHVLLTRFQRNPRSRSPDEMLPLLPPSRRFDPPVIEDPLRACEAALDRTPEGGTLVICGSFFLAAETRDWAENLSRPTG